MYGIVTVSLLADVLALQVLITFHLQVVRLVLKNDQLLEEYGECLLLVLKNCSLILSNN